MRVDLKENLRKAKDLILENNRIGIFTHTDPDGDAIGCVAALELALERMEKDVKAFLQGVVPRNFYFLPLPMFETTLTCNLSLIIVLDCALVERTGFHEEIKNLRSAKIINIDHHPQEDSFGHLNIVDTSSTSTSEIIFYLLEILNIEIDRELATYLLTGIFSDTGSFMHSNTTKSSLEIAAKLISKGANIKNIADNIIRRKNVSTLKLWGRVLTRVKNDREKGIVSSIITKKDLEECEATKADLEGVVNLINAIPESKAALLLTEDEDQIKGSLRSEEGGLDVNKLASLFGGGGHIRASGFRIKGKLRETEDGWEIIEE